MVNMKQVYGKDYKDYLASLGLSDLEQVVYDISKDIVSLSKSDNLASIRREIIKELESKKADIVCLMRDRVDELFDKSTACAEEWAKAEGDECDEAWDDAVQHTNTDRNMIAFGFDGFGKPVVMRVENKLPKHKDFKDVQESYEDDIVSILTKMGIIR